MEPNEEQQLALERLRENERLTSNLTDTAAAAVLKWAEAQLISGAGEEAVVAAVKAANKAEPASADEAIAVAQSHLPASPPLAVAATAPPKTKPVEEPKQAEQEQQDSKGPRMPPIIAATQEAATQRQQAAQEQQAAPEDSKPPPKRKRVTGRARQCAFKRPRRST